MEQGLLNEMKKQERNRLFSYSEYLSLFTSEETENITYPNSNESDAILQNQSLASDDTKEM